MGSTAVIEEPAPAYTGGEEVANALTHGAGFGLSIAALTVMVVESSLHGDATRIVSVSIFGASMVLMYLFSTLYHAFQRPSVKRLFRVFDHLCIYLLIAGTYTPFTLVGIQGGWGWSLFGVIWGLALAGVIFKIFFIGKLRVLSVIAYVAMGWLCIIAMPRIIDVLSSPALFWVVAGGVLYTLGIFFYAWQKLPYHHAIWHLFVLAGTTCHFLSIHFYIVPEAAT